MIVIVIFVYYLKIDFIEKREFLVIYILFDSYIELSLYYNYISVYLL